MANINRVWDFPSLLFDEAAAFAMTHLRKRAARGSPFHGIAVPVDDLIGQRVMSTGWFEATQFRAVTQMLNQPGFIPAAVNRDGLFVDVGANIGLYCIAFAEHFAAALAIEANPQTFALLQANVALRELSTTCLCVAASASAGEAEMFIPRDGNLGWASLESGANAWRRDCKKQTVPCRPLDALIAEHGGGRPAALLKIDVEGHELSVLHGARETLLRDKPVILFEVLNAENGAHCADFLQSCGYDRFFAFRREALLSSLGREARIHAAPIAPQALASEALVCALAA